MTIDAIALRAEDAEAIRRLHVEFHYLVDAGRATDCVQLLSADPVLEFGPGSPNPGVIAGTEAISEFLTQRQAAPVITRHVLSTPRITLNTADEAVLRSVLTLYKAPSNQAPEVPAAIADIEERYLRTSGDWRLAYRTVTPVAWA